MIGTMHIPDPPNVSYWDASPILRDICKRKLDASYEPRLIAMGERAAREVAPLAQIADRESPRLVTHDAQGNRINRVDYHPSYREMERIAYGSGMITVNYTDPQPQSRTFGFALGYLFAMAEMGLYCPLCMTDGVARVLTQHGTPDQIARVVPHLASSDRETLWTGGMFLTERSGGSDVGANETVARNGLLTGQKWFCSNVDADAVLVTARPEGAAFDGTQRIASGTRGLRTYLLLQRGNPGVTIDRLKEKLGVRSMPTGEVTLRDAPAEEVGGFNAIADMLNLSRLYNAVASVAVIGRAIHEARWYIERRQVFGRPVIEWPLALETMMDLEAEHAGAMLLTFETIDAMQRGDDRLLRILTPIAKAVTGKLAVPCVSEAMELIGGNGYIEESPMPRLLRDAQVLPIWEGTTNILVLDALRTANREAGHELLIARIRERFPKEADALLSSYESLDERDARGWIDRLARMFELTLLAENEYGEHVDRLINRPLGMLPGAKH
jgi:alkylation response protein AidB-like acyl-CoA dehydrogenase